MSRRRIFAAIASSLFLLCGLSLSGYAQRKSPLSAGSARNVIRRAAGIVDLPSSAVRVKSLSAPDRSTVDVLAQITTAFRFVKEEERWRVAEIRTGDNRWEETAIILRALGAQAQQSECAAVIEGAAGEEVDPDARLARCLIAELAGVKLPSDAVRVKSIAPLALGNAPSAVVEATVEAELRLLKGTDGKWRVAKIRTGDNDWGDVESLIVGINEQKRSRAQSELETLAAALEAFRRERGFYVEAETESALVDQLNPRYLPSVIRIDPWRRAYLYEGTRNAYTLRSNGADGLPDTNDDIIKTVRSQ